MSNTGLDKDNLELEVKSNSLNKLNKGYNNLNNGYEKLNKQNSKLHQENELLKKIIIKTTKKQFHSSLIRPNLLKSIIEYPKIGKIFYFQIFLGILVIVLSLGFHILYLSVTSCLMYNDGNPFCWIVSWLGIDIHASFYLDIILYSLIGVQIIIIILIIRDKLNTRYKIKLSKEENSK